MREAGPMYTRFPVSSADPFRLLQISRLQRAQDEKPLLP